jgi:uncharacterized protein
MALKPSEQEEEYFARLESARRTHVLTAQASVVAEEERQRVLAVAQHHCPTCGAPLVTVTYRSSAIDQCSRCQGVWLASGVLERLVGPESWVLSALQRLLGSGPPWQRR